MENRKYILEKLNKYKGSTNSEEQMRLETIMFVENNPDCFERSLKIGHITGSSWIVDESLEYALLTHHATLNKWFQLGGHSDGEWNTSQVSFREATEESGLKSVKLFSTDIFDIDIHPIPERGDEPEHLHYDIRFLLKADKTEPFIVSSESKDLAWIKLEDISNLNPIDQLMRMVDKTYKLRV